MIKYILICCLLFCGCKSEIEGNSSKGFKYKVTQSYGQMYCNTWKTNEVNYNTNHVHFKDENGKEVCLYGMIMVTEQ